MYPAMDNAVLRGFNPLPARRPGATCVNIFAICSIYVSILSQPEGRELPCNRETGEGGGGFNPLPARRPGATPAGRRAANPYPVSILSQPEGRELLVLVLMAHQACRVSILSQPEGRELRETAYNLLRRIKFQSSPSPKAGSYAKTHLYRGPPKCFNPLPARRPGATEIVRDHDRRIVVSILSQPEGRELRDVAILTWVKDSFNPLPARRPGATLVHSKFAKIRRSFNPLPARRPGATPEVQQAMERALVSILSQPEGRELHNRHTIFSARAAFQSSPSPKAGSYKIHVALYGQVESFNPLPARRPGATKGEWIGKPLKLVSILSQPEGRELRAMALYMLMADGVSILSQPEGRELLLCCVSSDTAPRFQSSPSPKAGSYMRLISMHTRYPKFQSSPSPKAGSYKRVLMA